MLIPWVNDGIADASCAQTLADVVGDHNFVAAHSFAQADRRRCCSYPTVFSR